MKPLMTSWWAIRFEIKYDTYKDQESALPSETEIVALIVSKKGYNFLFNCCAP